MRDEQKLWELLGKSPRSEAPPFFAGRVLREISASSEGRANALHHWADVFLRWFAPASIAALVLIGVLPMMGGGQGSTWVDAGADTDLTTLELVEMLSPEDYQILVSVNDSY